MAKRVQFDLPWGAFIEIINALSDRLKRADGGALTRKVYVLLRRRENKILISQGHQNLLDPETEYLEDPKP